VFCSIGGVEASPIIRLKQGAKVSGYNLIRRRET